MSEERPSTAGLKHAERYTVEGDDGKPLELVVLARSTVDGREYALLCAEKDVGTPGDDMDVYAFRFTGDDLANLDDEAEADKVMAHFSDLMGWA